MPHNALQGGTDTPLLNQSGQIIGHYHTVLLQCHCQIGKLRTDPSQQVDPKGEPIRPLVIVTSLSPSPCPLCQQLWAIVGQSEDGKLNVQKLSPLPSR